MSISLKLLAETFELLNQPEDTYLHNTKINHYFDWEVDMFTISIKHSIWNKIGNENKSKIAKLWKIKSDDFGIELIKKI